MNILYEKYKDRLVFTKDDIKKDFPHLSQNAINTKIYYAKKRKIIKGISGRRGLYFIIEFGQNYETAQPDIFKLAANISVGAIICYSSAIMVYGKSHSILNSIYISPEKKFRDLSYFYTNYKYVNIPFRNQSIEEISYKGTNIKVTNLERTLIDCLRNLQYSGGVEFIMKSYETVKYLNSKYLEDYLSNYSSPVLHARLGFLLEIFKSNWDIPDSFMKKLKKRIPKHPDYLEGRKSKTGKLIKEWSLIVPQELFNKFISNDGSLFG